MQSQPSPEPDPHVSGDPADNNPAAASGQPAVGPRTMTSSELLRGGRELRISHGDEIYRLLLTRTGKLLLQK